MTFANTRSALLILCAALVGCSRGGDEAPVATPVVSIATTDVSAGRAVDVTYRFAMSANARPLQEDYTVFVHVYDEGGTRLWTGDHQPPTPTREWKPGAVVEYTHPMLVPRRAKDGKMFVDVGLYSPRSGERLPLAGKGNGMRSYRVATLTVRPRPVAAPAVFVDGWHGIEAPEDAQGIEWRWSKREAVVLLRNPRRDSVLVVELDQPVAALPAPQQVEIRHGTEIADSFSLPPGQHEVRRVRLLSSQLGDSAIVPFTVAVDKTFVPASLPQTSSSDTRELGVRVFDVYFE